MKETTMTTIRTTTINFKRILMEIMETKITPTTHTKKNFRLTSSIRIDGLPSTKILEWFASYVTNLVMLPKCVNHTFHFPLGYKSTTQLVRIQVINQTR